MQELYRHYTEFQKVMERTLQFWVIIVFRINMDSRFIHSLLHVVDSSLAGHTVDKSILSKIRRDLCAVPKNDAKNPQVLDPIPEAASNALFLKSVPRRSVDYTDKPKTWPLASVSYPGFVQRELQKAYESREYNCIDLNEYTDNNALSTFLYYALEQENVIDRLSLSHDKCRLLATKIQESYCQVPFHNAMHGCTVLHSTIHLLRLSDILHPLDDTEHDIVTLCAYVAAAAHDIRHPGFTSKFLIATNHQLAQSYHDQSVLENYHIAHFFAILRDDHYNILTDLTTEQQRFARRIIISMILATDMELHATKMLCFQHRMYDTPPDSTLTNVEMMIKCADLSHCAMNWDSHFMWTRLLQEEMFLQGDTERDIGLTSSTLMDRTAPNSKGLLSAQNNFFTKIVIPLMETFTERFPACQQLLTKSKANCKEWSNFIHSRQ